MLKLNYHKNLYANLNEIKKQETVLFFSPFGDFKETPKICLSQWYNSAMTIDGFNYSNCEQYMMAEKSRLFNDNNTLDKILKTADPKICKKLGRQVKNFDPIIWDQNKIQIVYKGNYNKFIQNDKLLNYLLSTNEKILIEASPYDKIWGIGLDQYSKDCFNVSKWKGDNLLGFILMQVREDLNIRYFQNFNKDNKELYIYF